MSLTTAEITYNLANLVGIPHHAGTSVTASTNIPRDTVVDTDGNAIRLGSGKGSIDSNGAGAIDVWVPGEGSNPASWQTYIHVRYRDPLANKGHETRTFGPFTITASGDLADLIDEQEVPPEYVTTLTAELDGYVTEAEAAAAIAQSAANLASAISGAETADDLITILDADPESDYRIAQDARLEDSIAAALESVEGLAGMLEEAAQVAATDAIYDERPAKNLYNPADPDNQPGYTLSLAGARPAVVSATYTTTGYIPVVAGQAYTLSNPRNIVLYDASKVYVPGSDVSNASSATYTYSPSADGFIRASFLTATYGGTFQVEAGSIATSYEAYFTGTRLDIDPQFAATVGESISPYAGPLLVSKAGNALTITTALAGADLVQTAVLNGSANGSFNLTGATHGGVSIYSGTDEITPIRTQLQTVGANHGYPNVSTFTNPDGKTVADLGSVWTDGTREYVLLAIDGTGKLVVGGSYVNTGGLITSAAVVPTVNLTHVSGAVHTGAIVYTTRAASQLYPSIGRISVAVKADGTTIGDGEQRAAEVVVSESYDILDYAAIYDGAKANVGVSFATLTLAGAVRVANTFRWRGPVCRISTTYTELLPTNLAACGAIQAVPLAKTGTTLTRYLPGVGTVGGFDWTAGVDMTSYATNVVVTSAGLTSTQPPAFSLDVLAASGSPVLGFALGYLPFGKRGDEASRNSQRLARASSALWDMRSTKKSYPNFTTAEAAGWGRLTVEAFRAYLDPARVSAVVASKGHALTAWDALGLD